MEGANLLPRADLSFPTVPQLGCNLTKSPAGCDILASRVSSLSSPRPCPEGSRPRRRSLRDPRDEERTGMTDGVKGRQKETRNQEEIKGM